MTPLGSVTSEVRNSLRLKSRQRFLNCEVGGEQPACGLQHFRDPALTLPLTSSGGQVNAVLHRERFVDGLVLQTRGDEEADHIGDHQRYDDGVVLGHLEDHQDGGHRRAHDAGEDCSHADQRVGSGGRRVSREEVMRYGSYRSSHHGADEQCGSEDAARVA